MSAEVHDLLRDLEFISYVKPGQTINVGSKVLVSRGSIWSWMTRTPTGESVTRTIGWVKERISKAIDWIDGDMHCVNRMEIFNALINSISGIEALITTYASDEWNKAELVTVIRSIIKIIQENDQTITNLNISSKIAQLCQKYQNKPKESSPDKKSE